MPFLFILGLKACFFIVQLQETTLPFGIKSRFAASDLLSFVCHGCKFLYTSSISSCCKFKLVIFVYYNLLRPSPTGLYIFKMKSVATTTGLQYTAPNEKKFENWESSNIGLQKCSILFLLQFYP